MNQTKNRGSNSCNDKNKYINNYQVVIQYEHQISHKPTVYSITPDS